MLARVKRVHEAVAKLHAETQRDIKIYKARMADHLTEENDGSAICLTAESIKFEERKLKVYNTVLGMTQNFDYNVFMIQVLGTMGRMAVKACNEQDEPIRTGIAEAIDEVFDILASID